MMMADPMNSKQGELLVDLIATLRPDWQRPGILKFVRETAARTDAITTARAAINFTANIAARTPALMPKDGPHWPNDGARPKDRPRTYDMTCPDHPGQHHPCQTCAAEVTPATPEILAALRAAARRPA